jgi:hypothetical protein
MTVIFLLLTAAINRGVRAHTLAPAARRNGIQSLGDSSALYGGPDPAADRVEQIPGDVFVETSPGVVITPPPSATSFDFKVQTGAMVTIRVVGAPLVLATLYVVTPSQERLPYWEWVEPVAER